MAKKSKSRQTTSPADVIGQLERLACFIRASQHEEGLNPAQWTALRYLARANRFSNTVSGLADYLAATRGTTSQTLQALEKKGLVVSARRVGDGRKSDISLTESGRAYLARDPLFKVEQSFGRLGAQTRKRLARGASRFLKSEADRREAPRFGTCIGCQSFTDAAATNLTPQCTALAETLTAIDMERICAFYVKRSK